MGRCRCDSFSIAGCQCSVADTTGINFSGTGATGDPFTAQPIVDPSSVNLLSLGASGLLALSPDLIFFETVRATDELACAINSYQDIPGMSLSVVIPEDAMVMVLGTFQHRAINGELVSARLMHKPAGGSFAEVGDPSSVDAGTGTNWLGNLTQQWFPNTNTGTNEFKAQGSRDGTGDSGFIRAASRLTVIVFTPTPS